MSKKLLKTSMEIILVLICIFIFGLPIYFILINSFKNSADASLMNLSFPKTLNIMQNYKEVIMSDNGMVIRAFLNSSIITILSIILLILVSSMAGFILQRRNDKISSFINFLILVGLMIPPAIVPTIWILQKLHLFRTMFGMVLVEVALSFPFSALLYTSFMATIPKELDEAALLDGCNSSKLFFKIIFPLLKPVTSTITILSALNIFNDFVNPLYFLPGSDNVTVQLSLYYFMGKYVSSWNLLFADVVLISLPPLILFIFFNKQIIDGMVAGAIKG
jgi:raffinose/stachyose/melibiose transport system permease protein